MKLNKVISILVIFAVVFSLWGCKKNNNNTTSESEINETSTSEKNMEVVEDEYLVESGRSDYKIIHPENCTAAELFASSELSKFIYDSTGAEIEIHTDLNRKFKETDKYLVVGNTNLSTDVVKEMKSTLSTDGFVIKTVGRSIFLAGENDSGTLYCVYDFLESVFGIRFLL